MPQLINAFLATSIVLLAESETQERPVLFDKLLKIASETEVDTAKISDAHKAVKLLSEDAIRRASGVKERTHFWSEYDKVWYNDRINEAKANVTSDTLGEQAALIITVTYLLDEAEEQEKRPLTSKNKSEQNILDEINVRTANELKEKRKLFKELLIGFGDKAVQSFEEIKEFLNNEEDAEQLKFFEEIRAEITKKAASTQPTEGSTQSIEQ